MSHEFLTLKQKCEDLNDFFNRALEQRDLARSQAGTLQSNIQLLKADKAQVEKILKGEPFGVQQKRIYMEYCGYSHIQS